MVSKIKLRFYLKPVNREYPYSSVGMRAAAIIARGYEIFFLILEDFRKILFPKLVCFGYLFQENLPDLDSYYQVNHIFRYLVH